MKRINPLLLLSTYNKLTIGEMIDHLFHKSSPKLPTGTAKSWWLMIPPDGTYKVIQAKQRSLKSVPHLFVPPSLVLVVYIRG